jgi:regulatory protein
MPESDGGERDALAPVIPLFPATRESSSRVAATEPPDAGWHATWVGPAEAEPIDDAAAERGEKALLRKLRTRSLSLREARSALSADDLAPDAVEGILERFVALGYLDDRALAEQLIDKALSRKAQGRQAIAQTLAQRGIPREVIDEALSALPSDEAERALEFARAKAGQLAHLDRDTALRRLAGQLARRGFGSMALSAARTALDEATAGRRGVRFE